jgi:hypothetical protein
MSPETTFEVAGAALSFMLVFGFVCAIIISGLQRIFPILLAAAATVFAWELLARVTISKYLVVDLIWAGIALVLSGAVGLFVRHKTQERFRDAVNLRISEIVGDYRILVVFVSILVAALVTLIFAKLKAAEQTHDFWHGFYEAWTASLVFFAILGVAGTIVSLYRPEKEVFATKVRILCGGRIGPEVDYIQEVIRKIGYYSERVSRTYTIKDWDSQRNAYEIEVFHESLNANFFDDDADDNGSFNMKPDPLTPPLDPIGKLIEVNVDGKQVLAAEHIPVAGIRKNWPIQLKKGGRANIQMRHIAWYDVKEPHVFRPARFAKVVKVTLISELPGRTPAFSAEVFRHEIPDFRNAAAAAKIAEQGKLEPSVSFEIPEAKNCLPREIAFSLKFAPPDLQPPLQVGSSPAT